jgi:hypothetical protein
MLLVPCLVVGFVLSRSVHRRVPAHRIRTGVLTVCGASAAVLLVRSLAGGTSRSGPRSDVHVPTDPRTSSVG